MGQKRKLNLKLIIGITGIAVVLAAVITLIVLFAGRGAEFADVSLFYFHNEWAAEPIRMNMYASADELTEYALLRLARLPEQFPGARTFPRGLEAAVHIEYETCVVTFSEEFYALAPAVRAVAIASIVYTLTEFDFIEDVSIVSGEARFGPFGRNSLLLDDGLLPERSGTREYTLFYIHPAAPELLYKVREITLQPNRTVETLLVEELISPAYGLEVRRLFPAGVRLRNNATIESRICYIDFSSDFLAQIDSEETVKLIVKSIIYTITENTNATQVRLLFAGDRSAANLDSIDLSMPLSRVHFEEKESEDE